MYLELWSSSSAKVWFQGSSGKGNKVGIFLQWLKRWLAVVGWLVAIRCLTFLETGWQPKLSCGAVDGSAPAGLWVKACCVSVCFYSPLQVTLLKDSGATSGRHHGGSHSWPGEAHPIRWAPPGGGGVQDLPCPLQREWPKWGEQSLGVREWPGGDGVCVWKVTVDQLAAASGQQVAHKVLWCS